MKTASEHYSPNVRVIPFFIVKRAVVSFFVGKWYPNQIIVATQKGSHCPESNWKLVPDIIDKYSKPPLTGKRCLDLLIQTSQEKKERRCLPKDYSSAPQCSSWECSCVLLATGFFACSSRSGASSSASSSGHRSSHLSLARAFSRPPLPGAWAAFLASSSPRPRAPCMPHRSRCWEQVWAISPELA